MLLHLFEFGKMFGTLPKDVLLQHLLPEVVRKGGWTAFAALRAASRLVAFLDLSHFVAMGSLRREFHALAFAAAHDEKNGNC